MQREATRTMQHKSSAPPLMAAAWGLQRANHWTHLHFGSFRRSRQLAKTRRQPWRRSSSRRRSVHATWMQGPHCSTSGSSQPAKQQCSKPETGQVRHDERRISSDNFGSIRNRGTATERRATQIFSKGHRSSDINTDGDSNHVDEQSDMCP